MRFRTLHSERWSSPAAAGCCDTTGAYTALFVYRSHGPRVTAVDHDHDHDRDRSRGHGPRGGLGRHDRGIRDRTRRPAQRHPSPGERERPAEHVRRDRHQRRVDQRHLVHVGIYVRRVLVRVLLVLQIPTVETRG